MDFGLKKKRVLVQGSSSGLGFAMAKAFSEEGAIVSICSRNKERIKSASKQIPKSIFFTCDLDRKGANQQLIHNVIEKLGGIDILVINTGGPLQGRFLDLSLSDWQYGFEKLYLSAVESMMAVLPFMKSQKWGRILLSTSTTAKEPRTALVISSALRSGLLGLMKTVSNEVAADRITVNALMPGYIKTERLTELKLSEEELVQEIPTKRLGTAEEYAALAVFLASEQAAYVTGQAIACDGGLIRSY